MRTLTIDDDTYAALKERAVQEGLTVEEWVRRSVFKSFRVNGQPAARLTTQERLDRLQELSELAGDYGHVDFSRDAIYD